MKKTICSQFLRVADIKESPFFTGDSGVKMDLEELSFPAERQEIQRPGKIGGVGRRLPGRGRGNRTAKSSHTT